MAKKIRNYDLYHCIHTNKNCDRCPLHKDYGFPRAPLCCIGVLAEQAIETGAVVVEGKESCDYHTAPLVNKAIKQGSIHYLFLTEAGYHRARLNMGFW